MYQVEDNRFKFSGQQILQWITAIQDKQIIIKDLDDYGDIFNTAININDVHFIIPKYKECLGYLESSDKSYQTYIIPLAVFGGNHYTTNNIDLICRIVVNQTVHRIIFYGVINLYAYLCLNTIHLYMRDNTKLLQSAETYKPEEIKDKIIFIENSKSGLSKHYITEDNLNKAVANLYTVPHLREESISISLRRYKVDIIVNPIYKQMISEPEENLKAIDDEVKDMFTNFTNHRELRQQLNIIICNN